MRNVLIICILLCVSDSHADDVRLETWLYRHYSSADGLSQNTVNAITQDSHGFIWLGTQFGLNRFDGYEFETFLRNTHGTSTGEAAGLTSNHITQLATDQQGRVWAGSNRGVHYFDERLHNFVSPPDAPDLLQDSPLRAIHADNKEGLWLGNQHGLFYINTTDLDAIKHVKAEQNITHITGSDTSLFITTSNQQVSRFAPDTARMNTVFSAQGTELIRDSAFVPGFGLFIGTSRGLVLIGDDDTLRIHPDTLSNVYAIAVSKQNQVLIGTGEGLLIYNPHSGTLIRERRQQTTGASYGYTQINDIFISRQGKIWLGTQASGVAFHNPETEWIAPLLFQPDSTFSTSGKSITALAATSADTIWQGSQEGIARIDWTSRTSTYYRSEKGLHNRAANVSTFFIDRDDTLWVGHRPGGLSRFSSADNQFVSAIAEPSWLVTHINQLPDGQLLLLTRDHGFYLYSPDTEKLTAFTTDTHGQNGVVTNRFQHSYIDKQQRLWLGSFDAGLMLFDVNTESVTARFSSASPPGQRLPSDLIVSLNQLSDSDLAIGTNNGLVRLSLPDFKVLPFEADNRLADETIYAIISDDSQRLWMPTNSGLFMYDARTESLRQFTSEDGLPSDEFNSNAHALIGNALYSGGIAGLTRFDLSAVPEISQPAQPLLTQLNVAGSPITANAHPDILNAPLLNSSHITLPHDTRVFSLLFAALSFESPLKVMYRYRLTPFQQQWQAVDARRRIATYTNIDAGTYTFEVQAAMRPNQWSESTSVTLHIKPSLWQTPLFYLAYLLIVVGISGYIFHLIRQRQLLRKESYQQLLAKEQQLEKVNAELEDRVALRTQALQQTNSELSATIDMLKQTQSQLVEAEKMASLGSLVAGISHEINTPIGVAVTAISHVKEAFDNLLQKIATNALTQEQFASIQQDMQHAIALAAKNLDRASHLISSFKQVSVDQSAEQLRDFDVAILLDDTAAMMHPQLRAGKHKIVVNCPSIDVVSYPGALSQIIINLISNSVTHGFKHKQNGVITLTVSEQDDTVTIVYEDDGSGIEASYLEKVFTPFFTTNRAAGNTGLGMHISYNLATQKLKGTLSVASDETSGARFVITFPANASE